MHLTHLKTVRISVSLERCWWAMIVKIVLAGYGGIGRALVMAIRRHRVEIKKRYGLEFDLMGVADSSGAALSQNGLDLGLLEDVKAKTGRVSDYPKFGREGASVSDLLEETDAEILFDASSSDIHSGEPGLSNMMHGLSRDMHIVTTNKAALAKGYRCLSKKAKEMHVALKFRGCACTTIPCFDVDIYQSLGLGICGIEAIVNATSNYVLSRMSDGASRHEAIREAQDQGIAERDPALDLDGWDTACKMVILANWLLNGDFALEDVEVRGISNLTVEEIMLARQKGLVYRNVGEITRDNARINLRSYPKIMTINEPLALVRNLQKAILFHTEIGDVFIRTEHAGALPSAYALLQDAIEIVGERNDR